MIKRADTLRKTTDNMVPQWESVGFQVNGRILENLYLSFWAWQLYIFKEFPDEIIGDISKCDF